MRKVVIKLPIGWAYGSVLCLADILHCIKYLNRVILFCIIGGNEINARMSMNLYRNHVMEFLRQIRKASDQMISGSANVYLSLVRF